MTVAKMEASMEKKRYDELVSNFEAKRTAVLCEIGKVRWKTARKAALFSLGLMSFAETLVRFDLLRALEQKTAKHKETERLKNIEEYDGLLDRLSLEVKRVQKYDKNGKPARAKKKKGR